MARKITLLGASPPTIHAVIDERALQCQTRPASIMTKQLDELAQFAELPHVTIQVLPLGTGIHCGLEGAFSVLSFDQEDPDVGYVGCPGHDLFVEAASQVQQLRLTFERIVEMALSPEESAAVMAAARSNHDQRP
jgi:hypothetical protein